MNKEHSSSQGMAGIQTYFLVCMFGSSTWLTINAIWVELSLYTSRLPESWSLPSYLTFTIQLACIGPFLYSVLHKWVGLKIRKPPLILALLLLSTVCMFLLAFFWESTVFMFGSQHSVAIILLTFLMSLVSATSNVLFLPFMATFHHKYLTAYFVGMSLSSLVPSVLKLIQGVGNYECVPKVGPNGTSFTAVQIDPLFHIRFYNLTIFGWMCAATASFAILYWKGKTAEVTTKMSRQAHDLQHVDNGGNDGGEDGTEKRCQNIKLNDDLVGDEAEDESDEWRKERSPLKPFKKVVVIGAGKCGDDKALVVMSVTAAVGDGVAMKDDKVRYWTLIVCLSLVCAEMNTIIPSVHSYATLAYSLLTYHLALTLSNLSHPLANFLPLLLKPRSLPVVLTLVSICTVGTVFIFLLALQSPNPIFRNSVPQLGSTIVIALSVLTGFLCSYLRTHITGLIRGEHPDSESRLFWCGVFMQVGSFTGACIMFPLVNVFKVFQKRDPCT